MTDDTNRLKDRITNQLEQALREQRDEANRDDLGNPRGRVHDPKNTISDDHGRRHRREAGISRRKAAEKIDEATADAIEPRGGHPSDQRDDTDDSEDAPEEIAAAADGEGW